MDLKEIFLTEDKGLTSTSANYYCNIAKEILREDKNRLESIKFYNSSIKLINSTQETLTEFGTQSLDWISKSLDRIVSLNSFVAWCREAIKYKELISDSYYTKTHLDLKSLSGYTFIEEPIKEPTYTESDIFNELSETDRARYYALETKAATYGSYIHEKGSISDARIDLHKVCLQPVTVQGEGSNTIIIQRTPSIEPSSVNSNYIKLQEEYRKAEKELNSMKFKIREEVSKRNLAIENKYNEAFQKYVDIKHTNSDIINKKVLEILNDVSKLKIKVPIRFEKTLNYLISLDKKAE